MSICTLPPTPIPASREFLTTGTLPIHFATPTFATQSVPVNGGWRTEPAAGWAGPLPPGPPGESSPTARPPAHRPPRGGLAPGRHQSAGKRMWCGSDGSHRVCPAQAGGGAFAHVHPGAGKEAACTYIGSGTEERTCSRLCLPWAWHRARHGGVSGNQRRLWFTIQKQE